MKLYIILISFIALFFVSCEKHESRNILKDLEGNWELEKIGFGHGQNDPVSTLNFDETFLEFFPCDIDDNPSGSGNCKAVLEMDGDNIDLNYKITYGSVGTSQLRIYETEGLALSEEQQLIIDQLKKLSDFDFLDKKKELRWKSNNPFSSEFPSTAILRKQ